MKGDNVDFEMDETIVDIQDEVLERKFKKTTKNIKNINRVKGDSSKSKNKLLKGISGKPSKVDALALTLPLTDRNHMN